MAPRLKTKFKFSICSSWLPLPLFLIFGTWMLRALKEPVKLSFWQRQSPGLSLKEIAFSGSGWVCRRQLGWVPRASTLWVSEQACANMATLLTTSFRKVLYCFY